MRTCLLVALLALLSEMALAQDTSKVVVVNMRINGSGMEQLNSSVEYGLPPDCIVGEGPYDYSARASGVVISECGFSDPRFSTGDVINQNGTTEGITDVQPEADFTLVFPFNPAMLTLDIRNATTNETIFFNESMSGVVRDFCASHPQDADCAAFQPTPTPAPTAPPTTPEPTPAPSGCPLGFALVAVAGLGIAAFTKK